MYDNFKKNLSVLFQIFTTFAKIGPVTFGGGYAMISMIEKEVVHKKGWVKETDVADVFALSQSIPGAIAINSATFIGFKIRRTLGAIAALLGILLPTFLIVLALCMAFIYVQDNPYIVSAFKGIGAAVVALIAYAGFKTARTGVIDRSTLFITIATIVLLLFFHVNSIIVIVLGALVGIIVMQMKNLRTIKLHGENGKEKSI